MEIGHAALSKYQLIRGTDANVVTARAHAKATEWDLAWAKRAAADARRQERDSAARSVEAKKENAAERTSEAIAAIELLRTTLHHTLVIDDAIDWDELKDREPYPVPEPMAPVAIPLPQKPSAPREPQSTDPEFKPKMRILDYVSGERKRARTAEAEASFAAARANWQLAVSSIESSHGADLSAHADAVLKQQEEHAAAVARWKADGAEYLAQQNASHHAIDEQRAAYEKADPAAITDYCGMVLDNSEYPNCFPQDFELEYNPENRILIVDYQLPTPDDLPALIEIKYIASKDEFKEKTLPQGQTNQLYDSVLYEVALRTLHELFEADVIRSLGAVVFNGWVKSTDRATGLASEGCVLSLQAEREEFMSLDLAKVDPRACFRKLKGVSAAKLHGLSPVAPLLIMSREDKRFVSSYDVADSISGDNLAAMNWEDFEHLIRELFEKEFAVAGAEVNVTQASRDGGVDAVIFDPDPLHGGKTVVQAKRYTNTVGVSAVRDLYGTMMNEGANKGILVTTSDYGPDAYTFAKDKPLVLLNGGNLLHLLATHGHEARIDLKEAKLLLSESE